MSAIQTTVGCTLIAAHPSISFRLAGSPIKMTERRNYYKGRLANCYISEGRGRSGMNERLPYTARHIRREHRAHLTIVFRRVLCRFSVQATQPPTPPSLFLFNHYRYLLFFIVCHLLHPSRGEIPILFIFTSCLHLPAAYYHYVRIHVPIKYRRDLGPVVSAASLIYGAPRQRTRAYHCGRTRDNTPSPGRSLTVASHRAAQLPN